MRLRTTFTLTLTALTALALPACSSSSPNSATEAPLPAAAKSGSRDEAAAAPVEPLSVTTLRERLLNESDLGEGYVRKPESTSTYDDVTVIGCPAMENLGEAAAGGGFDFPRQAKVTFTYTGSSNPEVAEELYSDTVDKLSRGLKTIFGAMASCPKYQVVVGSTPIDMGTQKTTAPNLGEEQWSQLLTFTVAGQSSVIKQTAIRTGTTLMVISGSPGLVDSHIDEAQDKATAVR